MPEAYEQIDNGFISPNLPGSVMQRVRKQEGLKMNTLFRSFYGGATLCNPNYSGGHIRDKAPLYLRDP